MIEVLRFHIFLIDLNLEKRKNISTIVMVLNLINSSQINFLENNKDYLHLVYVQLANLPFAFLLPKTFKLQ